MEAIMWRLGQDATLRMTVGALVLVDRAPSADALAERLARVADHEPRLRWRVDEASALRGRPAWVDDPDPVPDNHLRALSVAAPGSLRQVLDLVSLLESIPFDPERSPWDVTVIDGLDDSKAVLYLRAHHALTDGLGGVHLLHALLDGHELSPASADSGRAAPPAVAASDETEPAPNGDRPRGSLTITIDVPSAVRRLFAGVNAARQVDPLDSAMRGVQRALDVANSVSRQMMVTGGPLSPRPAARSLLSHFEVISVEATRATSQALGGSRNDLLVAAAADGLGRYYAQQGHPTNELRLATPTIRRGDHDGGANWFAPARLEVPTSIARPGPQFGVVVERLAQARREPALRMASTLATTLGRVPTRLLVPALHAQADSVDFAATALPGLRGTPTICGCTVQATFPLGPRLGCPMNITAFGNDDRLDVGLALDSVAIAHPDVLIDCLHQAFASYAAAATSPSATRSG
jgi:WS/DGAT/MGAT family acyltransferase